MSSMMFLSIAEKTRILKDLKHRKLQHFNKEYTKLMKLIEEYHFLGDYKEELEFLKKAYIAELDKITMHDMDYERHDSIANEAESKYMQKLFDLKSRIISYKDRYINIISKYEVKDNIKYIEEYLNNEEDELSLILDMIKVIDKEEYQRIQQLDNAKSLKLKEAKVIYLKLHNTCLIKEELQDILPDLRSEEQEYAKILLEQKIIDKYVYREFMHAHYMNQQSEELSKIQESFEKFGYTFDEDIQDNSLHYINTEDNEYKIAIRVDNGNVTMAFTRLVPKGTSLTEYEKAKDVEKANQWCSDFDKIKKVMEENGLVVDENMRVEPSVENIRYEETDEISGEEEIEEKFYKKSGQKFRNK